MKQFTSKVIFPKDNIYKNRRACIVWAVMTLDAFFLRVCPCSMHIHIGMHYMVNVPYYIKPVTNNFNLIDTH